VFLSKWALARSRKEAKSLEILLPELLDPQHHLFTFMQFMKSIGDIYILQIYLDLSEFGGVGGVAGERGRRGGGV